MNGVEKRQHLRIRQPCAIRRAAMLPRPIAAHADLRHRTHLNQRIVVALFVDPGVLHGVSLAKYTVAFLGFRSIASVARSRLAVVTVPSALV